MMRIVSIGDEVLRCKAAPVEQFDEAFAAVLEDMFAAMKHGKGIGLAAPQVGIAQRFFVIKLEGDIPRVFVNPEITQTSLELANYEEGCLSVPGVYADVERPRRVTIQARNEKGRRFVLDADGLLARVIQHEFDHLEGILFTDKLPETRRARLLQQYEKRMRA